MEKILATDFMIVFLTQLLSADIFSLKNIAYLSGLVSQYYHIAWTSMYIEHSKGCQIQHKE